MKINPIGFNHQNYVRNTFVSKNTANYAANSISNLKSNGVDTVSFTGNVYTCNEPALKTIKKIKEKGGKVPERVEELAQKLAQDEKTKNANLYAVHRCAYKGLNDCQTLEEAKKMFPEFKNVKDANEVKSSFGSALEYLKSGCIEYFEEGCDVSLNVLKYYWYDLNTVKDFHWFAQHRFTQARFDYQNVFNKLNVPRFDKHYAQAMRPFKK